MAPLGARPDLERVVPDTGPSAYVHLIAALLAVAICVGVGATVAAAVDRVVESRIYDFIAMSWPQKDFGLAIQRAAVRRPDVVPLFGSSEVGRESEFHPRELFARGASGFSVLPVARGGLPLFLSLQNVAALGSALRGEKVAVMLSPPMFGIPEGELLQTRYAGTFSPLHALTMMLNDDLSPELKRRLAQRMAKRPELLSRSGELVLVVDAIADGSRAARARLALLWPLAVAKQSLLEFQDRLLVLARVMTNPPPRLGSRAQPETTDWTAHLAEATALAKARAVDNVWAVDAHWWKQNRQWLDDQLNSDSDEQFLERMAISETKLDLEQLLQVLQELGAETLVLSLPLDGRLWDYRGVSARARNQYYALVRDLAQRHGATARVMETHEETPYFFFDLWSHPSPKGWVYFDQVLEQFAHGTLQ